MATVSTRQAIAGASLLSAYQSHLLVKCSGLMMSRRTARYTASHLRARLDSFTSCMLPSFERSFVSPTLSCYTSRSHAKAKIFRLSLLILRCKSLRSRREYSGAPSLFLRATLDLPTTSPTLPQYSSSYDLLPAASLISPSHWTGS
jgi:hypothetical protein